MVTSAPESPSPMSRYMGKVPARANTGRSLTQVTTWPLLRSSPTFTPVAVTTAVPLGRGRGRLRAPLASAEAMTVVCSFRSPRVTSTTTALAEGGAAAASRCAGDSKREASAQVPATSPTAATTASTAHHQRALTPFSRVAEESEREVRMRRILGPRGEVREILRGVRGR